MLWEISFDYCCNCFHKLKKIDNVLKIYWSCLNLKTIEAIFYKEFSNKKLKNNLGLLKTIEILKKSLN